MTAKQLFQGTMPFIWAKLALGGLMVLIGAILLAIFAGIGWLFGGWGIVIMLLIWFYVFKGVRMFIMHYMGYLVKAGHIAVIAEACFTGQIPDNQVAYGKDMVIQRFVTSNVYFLIDKLVSGAVKEIQKGIGKVGNALDFIPGMEAITGVAQFFVSISLGYIDECCLGWTFYNKEQGAFKSAADGVVIYAQSWKTLLKDAAKTMLKVTLLTLGIALLIFIPIGILFKLLKWSPLIAFILALLIAWVVKFAAMDSYIMIQMMASYMSVAPSTVLAFDLYGNLCKISKKFKELWGKAQEEEPELAYATAGGGASAAASYAGAAPSGGSAQPTGGRAAFCGQCGAKNAPGTKFCGSCGAGL